MKNKSLVVISLLVLVAIFVGASVFFKQSQSSSVEKITGDVRSIPFVRDHSVKFGEDNRKVVLVEFIDPSCAPCGQFSRIVKKIHSEYEGDIQIVIRYLAKFKDSPYVVKILEASRKQDKFPEVLDVIFQKQHLWGNYNNPKPMLIWDYLKNVEGLDLTKLKNEVEVIDISKVLKLDKKDADILGVRGTPTVFVNGIRLQTLSYQTLDDLVISQIYK